jgi:hypothetical protein
MLLFIHAKASIIYYQKCQRFIIRWLNMFQEKVSSIYQIPFIKSFIKSLTSFCCLKSISTFSQKKSKVTAVLLNFFYDENHPGWNITMPKFNIKGFAWTQIKDQSRMILDFLNCVFCSKLHTLLIKLFMCVQEDKMYIILDSIISCVSFVYVCPE